MGDDAPAECIRRELSLLEPEVRASPDALRALLHPDFEEFGKSGRVYDLASTLELLPAEDPPLEIQVLDIRATRLAEGVVLVLFDTDERGVRAHRSSVWLEVERNWLLRFHQGTPTADR